MFVSSNQFYVFVACVAIGCVCGVFFLISSALKKIVKSIFLRAFFDIVAFFITSVIYVYAAFKFSFPNFRFYMIIGVLCGIYAYMKSFAIIVANIVKKGYNYIVNKKRKKRSLSNDGVKS